MQCYFVLFVLKLNIWVVSCFVLKTKKKHKINKKYKKKCKIGEFHPELRRLLPKTKEIVDTYVMRANNAPRNAKLHDPLFWIEKEWSITLGFTHPYPSFSDIEVLLEISGLKIYLEYGVTISKSVGNSKVAVIENPKGVKLVIEMKANAKTHRLFETYLITPDEAIAHGKTALRIKDGGHIRIPEHAFYCNSHILMLSQSYIRGGLVYGIGLDNHWVCKTGLQFNPKQVFKKSPSIDIVLGGYDDKNENKTYRFTGI